MKADSSQTSPITGTSIKSRRHLKNNSSGGTGSRGGKKLQERVTYYQSLLNVHPTSVHLRTQHKRWGTCTPGGDIYINWRLVMAPMKVLDYVIVHELAHLVVQDHSAEFWKIVKSVLPDYDLRKEWLRINGMTLYCIGGKKR